MLRKVETFEPQKSKSPVSWPQQRPDFKPGTRSLQFALHLIPIRTGIDPPVNPILALPGWFVAKARGAVTVVNHKQVFSAVRGNNGRLLSDAQIDLIARQLDTLCRDVED